MVPISQIFAYWYDILLPNAGDAMRTSHNAITEFVEIALLRILAAGRDGAVDVVCIDPGSTAMADMSLSICHLALAVRLTLSSSLK